MKANNAKEMREALLAIRKAMVLDSGNGPTTEFHSVVDTLTQAALAAPARNCDVGTAEEQRVRFEVWCGKQPERYCKACIECQTQRYAINCFCKWAQMPYEEGETDGSK